MLQEGREPIPARGAGVTCSLICDGAMELSRSFRSRWFEPDEPLVGDVMWVTGLTDPDGNALVFESPTDVPRESRLPEVEGASG